METLPPSAERAAEEALARIDSVNQDTADGGREAARRFAPERERAAAPSTKASSAARGGLERAGQEADPRTRERLEGLLGRLDDQLATQGSGG